LTDTSLYIYIRDDTEKRCVNYNNICNWVL